MKTLKNILTILILVSAFVFVGSFMTGCNKPVKQCFDCNSFPLAYQGEITGYLAGYYVETACITIDLTKFTGIGNFEIGKELIVEYQIRQGEFCKPESDKSTYRVYSNSNTDSPAADVSGPSGAIKRKL